MADYWRVLQYPLAAILLGDTAVVIAGVLVPSSVTVMDSFSAFVVPIMPFGVWIGYNMVQSKARMMDVILAGAIGGLWCGFLNQTEVGLMLTPIGTYNPWDLLPYSFALIVIVLVGAVMGGGFALMGPKR